MLKTHERAARRRIVGDTPSREPDFFGSPRGSVHESSDYLAVPPPQTKRRLNVLAVCEAHAPIDDLLAFIIERWPHRSDIERLTAYNQLTQTEGLRWEYTSPEPRSYRLTDCIVSKRPVRWLGTPRGR